MTEYNKNPTKNGLYVKLEVRGDGNSSGGVVVVLPLTEETFSEPTDKQQFFQPVDELFKQLSQVLDSSKTSIVGAGIDIAMKLQDLFGARLFQMAMYRQAWKKPSPATIDIKLDFNWGMLEEFNALIEVFNPIKKLKSLTLPYQEESNKEVLRAPGPTALNVYKGFAETLIKTTIQGASNTVGAFAGAVGGDTAKNLIVNSGTVLAGAISTGMSNVLTSLNDTTGNYSRLWYLKLISQVDGSSSIVFESAPLVCHSSSVNYSNQIDDTGYPISGSIRLSFESQIPTTSAFYEKAGKSLVATNK
jgi:hypothetical protein